MSCYPCDECGCSIGHRRYCSWSTYTEGVWRPDAKRKRPTLEDAIRELETKPRTFYLPDGSEVVDVEVQP